MLIGLGAFCFFTLVYGLVFLGPVPIPFIGLALLGLGLAIVGYVFIRRPDKEWDWPQQKPGYLNYDLFKWMGYTEKQMQEDSLLFRWSPKSRKFGRRMLKIVGSVLIIVGTGWFLGTILYLLGIFGPET